MYFGLNAHDNVLGGVTVGQMVWLGRSNSKSEPLQNADQ